MKQWKFTIIPELHVITKVISDHEQDGLSIWIYGISGSIQLTYRGSN